jgi:hypothetical protein
MVAGGRKNDTKLNEHRKELSCAMTQEHIVKHHRNDTERT